MSKFIVVLSFLVSGWALADRPHAPIPGSGKAELPAAKPVEQSKVVELASRFLVKHGNNLPASGLSEMGLDGMIRSAPQSEELLRDIGAMTSLRREQLVATVNQLREASDEIADRLYSFKPEERRTKSIAIAGALAVGDEAPFVARQKYFLFDTEQRLIVDGKGTTLKAVMAQRYNDYAVSPKSPTLKDKVLARYYAAINGMSTPSWVK